MLVREVCSWSSTDTQSGLLGAFCFLLVSCQLHPHRCTRFNVSLRFVHFTKEV